MNEKEKRMFYAMKRRMVVLTRLTLIAVFVSVVALLLSLVTSCTSEKANAESVPEPVPVQKVEKKSRKTVPQSLGTFTATAYCPCYECSEGWGDSTSTGATAKEGRTIAVDPKVIPYGTTVIINGKEYVAEDCGGAIKGNKIDIYFDTHEETLEWGKREVEVFKK